jgi:hypothetical protein
MRDIAGLYLNPPNYSPVLRVEEKSQIQALNRTQPVLAMELGYVEGVTDDCVRHGRLLCLSRWALLGPFYPNARFTTRQPTHRGRGGTVVYADRAAGNSPRLISKRPAIWGRRSTLSSSIATARDDQSSRL